MIPASEQLDNWADDDCVPIGFDLISFPFVPDTFGMDVDVIFQKTQLCGLQLFLGLHTSKLAALWKLDAKSARQIGEQ
jgi:hypothetical protein